LVIDAEESCARARVEIVAGVRNMEGTVYVTSTVRVVTPVELTDSERACGVLCALFTPGHRRAAFVDAQRVGFTRGATLIDPTSPVARSAVVGQGVFINPACVVAGSCELADWALVNRSASIGHHARIGTYASIGPGVVLAGNVSIGRGAVIGAGAIVLPEVAIGDNSVVAAGSVVRDTVPPHSVVAGNPCRVTKTGIEGYKGFSI
jgi:sugar O-acyltransferase (sialic acid O-acetyltransferase NeuD family)